MLFGRVMPELGWLLLASLVGPSLTTFAVAKLQQATRFPRKKYRKT